MKTFYCFLDFETTGLDPRNLTVLEAAWTVTDEDFKQLTPLTSRYCNICTHVSDRTIPAVHGDWLGIKPDPFVQKMHKESGLHADWLRANQEGLVVDRVRLDDAILASLWRAGWSGSCDTVFLAGAGVSHFDRLVLDAMASELTVGDAPPLHYRAADVSSALSLLGIPAPKTVDVLIELAGTVGSSLLLTSLISEVGVAGFPGPESQPILNRVVQHRAAPDVAFALVLSRCLRAMTKAPAV